MFVRLQCLKKKSENENEKKKNLKSKKKVLHFNFGGVVKEVILEAP